MKKGFLWHIAFPETNQTVDDVLGRQSLEADYLKKAGLIPAVKLQNPGKTEEQLNALFEIEKQKFFTRQA